MSNSPKNILVFNVNWMGDVVFSSSVFKALRGTYPDSKISCIAVARVSAVLEAIEEIDQIIIFDEENRHKSFFAKVGFALGLRKQKFDMVFLLHRSFTRALMMFLAGIPQRIGYDTKNLKMLLTNKTSPRDMNRVHRADYYLNVVESFGIEVKDKSTSLKLRADWEKTGQTLLDARQLKAKEYIVINTGGNWDLKQWPEESFTKLIHCLKEHDKMKIVICGAQKDVERVKRIVCHFDSREVIDLTGKTNLYDLFYVMAQARLLISADTGPMHIANSFGTDVVAIFGPTRPEITGPRGSGQKIILQYDVGCNKQACYHLSCTDNVCMKAVSVKDVVDAVRQIKG